MGIGSAIGGIAGGLLGKSAADDAADAQADAARQQLQLEERIYGETVDRFQPFLQSGLNAQNALAFELGLGERPTFGGNPMDVVEFTETVDLPPNQFTQSPRDLAGGQGPQWVPGQGYFATTRDNTRFRVGDQIFDTREAAEEYANANPTGGFEYQGFRATPGYQFQLDQGQAAIDNSAASRGSLFSGATLKSQQQFGQGLADQGENNFLNRLTGMGASGQAAAGNAANAGANFATGSGNALAGIGNAQAAGAIGGANALNAGINNAIGAFNYQNQVSGGNGFNLFGSPGKVGPGNSSIGATGLFGLF